MDASPSPSAHPRLAGQTPALAVVVPVHNEADNLRPLIAEIMAVLDGGEPYEIVYVDDGSTDGTTERLRELAGEIAPLRVVRHRACAGQSAALWSGIAAARAPLIVTLDGDGQNDPADVPRLIEAWRQAGEPVRRTLMIAGLRARRRDSGLRRLSSRVANGVRARLLRDNTPDTGCGLKVFPRSAFLAMPCFDHMHRFLPALMLRQGGSVVSIEVHHRPRARGTSKYGLFDRLWVGIADLCGVMWLRRRALAPEAEELEKGK